MFSTEDYRLITKKENQQNISSADFQNGDIQVL